LVNISGDCNVEEEYMNHNEGAHSILSNLNKLNRRNNLESESSISKRSKTMNIMDSSNEGSPGWETNVIHLLPQLKRDYSEDEGTNCSPPVEMIVKKIEFKDFSTHL
jgi:hypothetical protein